mmetsp:Transcript_15275/g.37518  ORF Transcript_15275/g.37518 Transcript_15275/m.37518 type:complete len:235 (+) Transcript_15275:45-749(+)
MIPNLFYSGCGLCYNEEYDAQIREGVNDMKKEDKNIHAWKSNRASSVSSSKDHLLQRSRSKQTRFAAEYGDEEEYSHFSAQTPPYRLRPRKHGRGRWDASAMSTSARKMQVENSLLQRNLRAAQKELLVQDKMIIQLESDLQVKEIEQAKLEDKMYLMQLDLEDAQTALRREVLRNQENERLLQDYRRLEEEQRQSLEQVQKQQQQEEEQRQEAQRQEAQRQEEQNWFGPFSWK